VRASFRSRFSGLSIPLIATALLGSCGSLDDGKVSIVDSTGGNGGTNSRGGSGADAGETASEAGAGGNGASSSMGGAGGAGEGGGAGGMPALQCDNQVTDVELGTPLDASTTDAENVVPAADCGGSDAGDGPDLVYSLTLEAAADVAIILQTPDFDGVLRLMTTSCDPASTVWKGCATDTDGQVELVLADLPAGSYYLAVDGASDADFGDFTLDVATTDPACPLSNLKIERVNSATPQSTQLFNRGDCDLDLSWFGTFHQQSETGGVLTELPAMTLGARETIWLADVNPPPDGQIYLGDSLGYSAEKGGVVYLCRGACKPPAGDNVLDAFYFAGTTEYTFLSGVTFDAGATGVSDADDAQKDYFRLNYEGSYPNFTISTDYIPAFLLEKFEDRSIADWTDAGQASSFTVTYESPPGSVGSYALALSGGFLTTFTGYRYDWSAPIKPTYISYRVRTASTLAHSGYFYGQDAGANNLISGYISNAASLVVNGIATAVAANTWYQVIITDIDYVAKTCQVTVNGTPKGSASLAPTLQDLSTLHIFNYDSTKVWYDQIIVR
jgi:hypothetical protein